MMKHLKYVPLAVVVAALGVVIAAVGIAAHNYNTIAQKKADYYADCVVQSTAAYSAVMSQEQINWNCFKIIYAGQ